MYAHKCNKLYQSNNNVYSSKINRLDLLRIISLIKFSAKVSTYPAPEMYSGLNKAHQRWSPEVLPSLCPSGDWARAGAGRGRVKRTREEDTRGRGRNGPSLCLQTAWPEKSASKLCYYQSVKYYDGQSEPGAFLKFWNQTKVYLITNAYLFQI